MDILEDLLQRSEKAEARLHKLEDTLGRFLSEDWLQLGRALQAKVGTLEDPPQTKVKKEPLPVLEGVECPDHPDAGVTANGCTAKGCTYSPPVQPAQSA